MAKTINNWCLQGIVHSVQMDCSFRRNDGKNDNRSNRNGTTLLALDWEIYLAIINCHKEMHFQPCNELEGLWGRCIFVLKQNSY